MRFDAIAFVHLLEAHHVLAGARRRQEIELHGLAPPWRLDSLDLLQLLDPALYLRGMRGARLEALDEVDFLGQHRLLALELGLLLLLAQRALLLIEFIIAGIGRQLTAIDLDHFGNDAVHELAVMRGHEQRALIAFEKLLQPDQAFEVEMVARSSSSMASGRIKRIRASATRIFQPPDSAPTSPSIISSLKLSPQGLHAPVPPARSRPVPRSAPAPLRSAR